MKNRTKLVFIAILHSRRLNYV